MEIQVSLSFRTISHSVNSKYVKTVRVAAAAARIRAKTKRQRLYRNVGFERNPEVENLSGFHKQGRLSVFICYFSVLFVSIYFPSACLHNLPPLYPFCFPFLTVLITPPAAESHLLHRCSSISRLFPQVTIKTGIQPPKTQKSKQQKCD